MKGLGGYASHCRLRRQCWLRSSPAGAGFRPSPLPPPSAASRRLWLVPRQLFGWCAPRTPKVGGSWPRMARRIRGRLAMPPPRLFCRRPNGRRQNISGTSAHKKPAWRIAAALRFGGSAPAPARPAPRHKWLVAPAASPASPVSPPARGLSAFCASASFGGGSPPPVAAAAAPQSRAAAHQLRRLRAWLGLASVPVAAVCGRPHRLPLPALPVPVAIAAHGGTPQPPFRRVNDLPRRKLRPPRWRAGRLLAAASKAAAALDAPTPRA